MNELTATDKKKNLGLPMKLNFQSIEKIKYLAFQRREQ